MAEDTNKKEKSEKKSGRTISILTFLFSICALIFALLAYFKSNQEYSNSINYAYKRVKNYFHNFNREDLPLDFGKISQKIRDASADFKLSESYELTKLKMEEIINDLQDYKSKVKPKYQEKYNKLMADAQEAYLTLKDKTDTAGAKLDTLVKKVDKFLSEDNEEGEDNIKKEKDSTDSSESDKNQSEKKKSENN